MAGKTYDVTWKELVEPYTADWAMLVSPQPVQHAEIVDADVSTLSGASDKVIRVQSGGVDWLLNLEAQADHDLTLPERLHFNATVLRRRHSLPVRSAALLLRREANASNMTGEMLWHFPGETDPQLAFRFQVLRVWQLPLEPLLTGSLGVLPLAPLTDAAVPLLPTVIARIDERLRQEVSSREEDSHLRNAIILLMGMRYEPNFLQSLFRGVATMLESTSWYPYLMNRGGVAALRSAIKRMGQHRFGPPSTTVSTTLDTLDDINELEQLSVRLLDASSWEELLATLSAAPPSSD
jgi:predicted transposase YdaD